MTITDLRRLNLRQWIADKYGGQQSRFAEAASVNQGELSSLLKNKSFGEKKARKIEQAASMPDMWLDTLHDTGRAGTGPNNPKESRKMTAISTIPEILADIKAGKMVIITDAEDRENEGDLLMAAQFVTPEAINFMIKNARGLVCRHERRESLRDTARRIKTVSGFPLKGVSNRIHEDSIAIPQKAVNSETLAIDDSIWQQLRALRQSCDRKRHDDLARLMQTGHP